MKKHIVWLLSLKKLRLGLLLPSPLLAGNMFIVPAEEDGVFAVAVVVDAIVAAV
jgi:hypothetical protein